MSNKKTKKKRASTSSICPKCQSSIVRLTDSVRRRHVSECGVPLESCECMMTREDGGLQMFTKSQLSSHLTTQRHLNTLQTNSNVVAEYGRTPLSAGAEQRMKYHTDPIAKRHPFTFGTHGCEYRPHDQPILDWLELVQKFDTLAKFKIVRFASSASDLLTDLPRIVSLMNDCYEPLREQKEGPDPPENGGWAAFEGSFSASSLFQPPWCAGRPRIVDNVEQLTKVHAEISLSLMLSTSIDVGRNSNYGRPRCTSKSVNGARKTRLPWSATRFLHSLHATALVPLATRKPKEIPRSRIQTLCCWENSVGCRSC